MRIYFFSIYLVLTGTILPVTGQISGYQGKRWVFSAGPGLNTAQLFIKDHRLEAFSQASAQVSYVTSRHGCTSLGLTYLNTNDVVFGYKYAQPGQPAGYTTQGSYLPYNRWVDSVKQQFCIATVEQRFILNGRKGALAPCGVYVVLGAGAYLGGYTGLVDSLKPYTVARQFGALAKIGAGSQKVYSDRIVVDFGLESSLPLSILAYKSTDDLGGYPDVAYSQYENSTNQTAVLWFMALASPYLRIGILR